MQTRSQTQLLSLSKSSDSMNTNRLSPVTRSQTRCNSPTFDFDAASIAWRQNKNKLDNGVYSYKNTAPTGITTRSGLVLSA